MNKISVIIPTILKNPKVLLKLINLLSDDVAVDEILIIENSGNGLYFPPNDKIKIYNSKENLYVNASWNLGISMIKNERFLIINDDILPVKNFCSLILDSEILEKDDTGLVGIDTRFIKQNDRKSTSDITIPDSKDTTLKINRMGKILGTGDWGSAYFGKKESYYEIPEDLKIIYGDNYLLKMNQEHKKINYKISGLPFNHIHSLSSASAEFSNIIGSDINNSKKYFS